MSATVEPLVVRGEVLPAGAEHVNVAEYLVRSTRARPDRAAILAPSGSRGWRATTYAELGERCDAIAHGLVERGVERGDRVALFVRPGVDLIAVTFALFKVGAVPILLDPGLGRANVVASLERLRPRVLIGVPLAHALRAVYARRLSSIAIAIVVGRALWPGLETLQSIVRPSRGVFRPASTHRDETAAILFTSGSTGPPKGVVYTHGMFDAQIRALRALYRFQPLERDLACFPLFALFDLALETTCVFPRLDPLHPAQCDPRDIADAILAHGCTYGFGSPAIWRRVVPWAIERGVRFPTMTRALIAGAPVSTTMIASLRTLLAAQGDVHAPYGATECLPVSSISGAELEDGVRQLVEGGHGSCVGRPAPGIEVAIAASAPHHLAHLECADRREIGEICVRGEVVTRAYADDIAATERSKITDGRATARDGRRSLRDGQGTWHRTGDAGYLDEEGRLWTVGRMAHGIPTPTGTRWPVPLENVCDLHPRARRTAFVGVGTPTEKRPCLVIEPLPSAWPRSAAERAQFAAEMRALVRARARPGSPAPIDMPDRVLFHRSFPVDVRHNAKIRREELAVFAGEHGLLESKA